MAYDDENRKPAEEEKKPAEEVRKPEEKKKSANEDFDFTDAFKEFLVKCKGIDPDSISPENRLSVYNSTRSDYDVWDRIPSSLRDRLPYPIPQDVWEAAQRNEIYTLREMEYNRDIKQVSEAREKAMEEYGTTGAPVDVPADIVNDAARGAFIAAVVAGYAAEASHQLAAHRQFREAMRDKVLGGNMTEDDRKVWRESRAKDADTIKKDWAENQPERMFVRLMWQHDRGKLSPEDEAKFPQMIEDLMQKIESPDNNRLQHLLDYVKSKPIQAKIKRFKEETLDLMSHAILRNGNTDERGLNLAREFARRRDELHNLPDKLKAKMVSDSLSRGAANLPDMNVLSAGERLSGMPSLFNKDKSRSR